MSCSDMTGGETGTCVNCGALDVEVCWDGYCRQCHVSLSFEDCVSGRWNYEQRAAAGLPRVPAPDDEVKA